MLLKQQILELDRAGAEIIGRKRNCFPSRAASLHILNIIRKLNAKEDVILPFEIVNIPAVKIDIGIFYFIRENKRSRMRLPEYFLPGGQPVNIVSRYPAFKAGKLNKTFAGVSPSFYFCNDYGLIRRIQKVIEAFELACAQRRPLLLIYGDITNLVIRKKIRKRPLVMI